MRRITSYFVAGLAAMLPTVATVYVLGVVFRILDGIGNRYVHIHIPGFGALATLAVVLLLGLVMANVFGRKLVGIYDTTLQRVPIIRYVYTTVKQLVDVVASPNKTAFRKLVRVEWPSAGLWSMGYLVSESSVDGLASIFVPTSPNPATGFVVLTTPDRYRVLDMSGEDGMRFIVSCGALSAVGGGDAAPGEGEPEQRESEAAFL